MNGYSTTQDLLTEALQKLLGEIAPGVGPILTPFLLKQGLSMFGISPTDPMLQTILQTDMSVFGAYRKQQDDMLYSTMRGHFSPQLLSRNTSRLARDNMETFFKGLARTTTTYDAWKELNPAEQMGSYDEFIQQKVAGYMSNTAWTTAYKFMDPTGSVAAGESLAQAAINIARPGMLRDNRDSIVMAQEIVNGLFRDDNGKFSFNKADYGNMTQSEVATLAAAITKDSDLLSGIGGMEDTGKLKEATTRLRDRVKEYADALSPLKDVFGEDIPSLLKAAEELSGQSINTMGPERAREIATTAIYRTASGRYSMNELGQSTSGIRQQLAGMPGVTSMTSLGALEIAADTLDAINTTNAPVSMTQQQYVHNASQFAVRAAGSMGAEMFNQAFAIWAEKNAKGTTKEAQENAYAEFRQLYNTARAGGSDEIRALLGIAGVSNTAELSQNSMYSSWYARAQNKGLGADLATDASVDRLRQNFIGNVLMVHKNNIGLDKFSTDDQSKMLNAVLDNFVSVQGLSEDERLKVFRDKGFSDAQGAVMGRAVNLLQQSDAFNPLEVALTYQASVKKAEEEKRITEDRAKVVKTVQDSIASNKGELITRLLGLDTGEGYKEGALTDYLSKNSKFLTEGSRETARETEYVVRASSLLLDIAPGTKELTKEQQARLAKDAAYSATDGLSNKNYRAALKSFMASKGQDKKAARLMQLYQNYGTDYVNTYLGVDENGIVDVNNSELGARLDTLFSGDANDATLKKRLINNSINTYLAEHDGDDNKKELSAAFKKLNREFTKEAFGTASDTLTDSHDVTSDNVKAFASKRRAELKEQKDTEGLRQLDSWLAGINQATKGGVSGASGVSDILGTIADKVREMVTKIGSIDSKLPPTSESPPPPPQDNRNDRGMPSTWRVR